MDAGVLVFADLSSGQLDDAGKGILAEGQRLAALLDTSWGAACFAGAADAAYEGFKPYGAPEVMEIHGPDEMADFPGAQAEALAEIARAAGAKLVLFAHTDLGSTLAPMLAARLEAALFTEAVSYNRDWAGLTVRRQVLGAQVVEQRIWADASQTNGHSLYGRRDTVTPLVLTVLPRVLSAVVLSNMKPGKAQRTSWIASVPTAATALRITERIPPDPQTMDVADAQVIFTGGKGCDRKTFDVMRELAQFVGASVGVTRPVYDLGWAGFERMIGQTGKTVVPRLYFAWGISGSMHHVGGITNSKRIVCLNIDPKAPIFTSSDEGFVADVREVLPLVVQKLRAAGARDEEAALRDRPGQAQQGAEAVLPAEAKREPSGHVVTR